MKIGITHTGNPEKHQYYIDWVTANDNLEIVTLSAENNNLRELQECDGLILSGGVDIHPKFYGNNKSDYVGAPEKFNEKRDQFEIEAYNLAQERNLPVLGICRGMQLINVIHQGTLIQNIDNRGSNIIHVGNPDKSHEVSVKEGTILHNIIGEKTVDINSAHHQAIDKLGEDLVVNAMSGDDVIEGIERKNKAGHPFLLAIQWHPERMFRFHLENTAASNSLRGRFIAEVKKSMEAK